MNGTSVPDQGLSDAAIPFAMAMRLEAQTRKVSVRGDIFSASKRSVKVQVKHPVLCGCGERAIADGLCQQHHPAI